MSYHVLNSMPAFWLDQAARDRLWLANYCSQKNRRMVIEQHRQCLVNARRARLYQPGGIPR